MTNSVLSTLAAGTLAGAAVGLAATANVAPSGISSAESTVNQLKSQGYQPTDLHLSTLTRLGGRMTQANIAFDDHPSARRFTNHIDTVTVDSMFAWTQRTGLSQSPQLIKQ